MASLAACAARFLATALAHVQLLAGLRDGGEAVRVQHGARFGMTTDNVRKVLARAAQDARLPMPVQSSCSAPRLRLHARQQGTDTRTIQAFLGHRSIQHTVRYTELAPDASTAVQGLGSTSGCAEGARGVARGEPRAHAYEYPLTNSAFFIRRSTDWPCLLVPQWRRAAAQVKRSGRSMGWRMMPSRGGAIWPPLASKS